MIILEMLNQDMSGKVKRYTDDTLLCVPKN